MNLDVDKLPANSFVLIPAERLKVAQKLQAESCDGDCDETKSEAPSCETSWNSLMENLQDAIEQNFPVKKWMLVKNLVRELLRVKDFCIGNDGRMLMMKHNPSMKIPVLDFVTVVTRQQGPGERAGSDSNFQTKRRYSPFVKALLKNNCPVSYIKNKSFLSPAAAAPQIKKMPFAKNVGQYVPYQT